MAEIIFAKFQGKPPVSNICPKCKVNEKAKHHGWCKPCKNENDRKRDKEKRQARNEFNFI